jgi:hypothetical protein
MLQEQRVLRQPLLYLSLYLKQTGGRRDRVFVYGRYLDVLNEGTEPIRG